MDELAGRLHEAARKVRILAAHAEHPWQVVARAAFDAPRDIGYAVSVQGLWAKAGPVDRAVLMSLHVTGHGLYRRSPPQSVKGRPVARLAEMAAELAYQGQLCDRYTELTWPRTDPVGRHRRHERAEADLEVYLGLPERWRAGVLCALARPSGTSEEFMRLLQERSPAPSVSDLLGLAADLTTASGEEPDKAAPPYAEGTYARYAMSLAHQFDRLTAPWQQCVLLRLAAGEFPGQALADAVSARSYLAHVYQPLVGRLSRRSRSRRRLFPKIRPCP